MENYRASVSVPELSLGNASILLRRCNLNDRGRYRCQVTKKERTDYSFVTLRVEAPIRFVDIQMTRLSGYEEVMCSTSDVYPHPYISWSTDSATPSETLKYTTRIKSDNKGLYSVESKLKKLVNQNSLTYVCTINSSSADQMWTASLSERVHNNVTITSKLETVSTWSQINSSEGQNLTIPCRSPWNLGNFTLTWSFRRADMSSKISTYDSRTQRISNHWNGTALLEPRFLQAGDGSLRLLGAQSLEHTGEFTCNISALQRNCVGHTRVTITAPGPENKDLKTKSHTPLWIPVTVVLATILITVAVIVAITKLQNKFRQTAGAGTARYSREVKVSVNKSEEITEGSHLNPDPTKEGNT
ncbi:uncharacterized protein hhla2b.1 isoform X2 [Silurus meridionalis]|nr:uncharacterized protein hhla2b.1 isoform X2 [Silurus meridionalis]